MVDEINTKNNNIYDYIFIENNGELLKYKITIDHVAIFNTLDKYINEIPYDNIQIVKEKDVKKWGLPTSWFRYVGKFQLGENLLPTNNYLFPPQKLLFRVLTDKYKNELVTTQDLYNLSSCYKNKYLKDLFRNIKIELIEKYKFNQSLEEQINIIENLVGKKTNSIDSLQNLKWILETSKKNKKYIKLLNLTDSFYESKRAYIKEKQKIK